MLIRSARLLANDEQEIDELRMMNANLNQQLWAQSAVQARIQAENTALRALNQHFRNTLETQAEIISDLHETLAELGALGG